ncbi:MAG: hypothetical protein ACYSW8_27415 [Planctomycetota bacterium]|jgi:hypothetical protein
MTTKKTDSKPSRRCGNCTTCCIVMDTTAADPAGIAHAKCGKLCSGGCSIYDDRPEFCKTYQCTWLRGYFSNADRPDRIGVIVEAQETSFGPTWVIHAVHQTALKQERGKRIYDTLVSTGKPVIVLNTDGTRNAMNVSMANVQKIMAQRDRIRGAAK